jgi:hypothetical protein
MLTVQDVAVEGLRILLGGTGYIEFVRSLILL